jgi:hypothetical protein
MSKSVIEYQEDTGDCRTYHSLKACIDRCVAPVTFSMKPDLASPTAIDIVITDHHTSLA